MRTPNRVGFQLPQDLCDILNEGNRMIVECGCEKPSHICECADWDADGYVGIQMFTAEAEYEKMQPALKKMYAKLKKHNYMSAKEEPHTFVHEEGLTLSFCLQRVNITVRDRKGAKKRVLTYEEYGRRHYAAKLKGKDDVIRVWAYDHQLDTLSVQDRYEWFVPMQYDRESIQRIIDKKMGEGKYIAIEITDYPRDKRKKPTTRNTVYERDSLTLRYIPAYGHYEIVSETPDYMCAASISPEECERLKTLGIEFEH